VQRVLAYSVCLHTEGTMVSSVDVDLGCVLAFGDMRAWLHYGGSIWRKLRTRLPEMYGKPSLLGLECGNHG
jgi:hypothetical protein